MYKNVRRVLDRDGWYYMGTEYMECRPCGRKWASWSPDITQQLVMDKKMLFPAILTYRWVSMLYFRACFNMCFVNQNVI